MQKTALHDNHVRLGAKMVDFAGYRMPIEYESINKEHLAVRTGVGIFDVSHMGEFIVQGDGAINFLQKMMVNDIDAIAIGKVQYNCMPNGLGGIVDDLLVYKNKDSFLLVVNASNIKKDWEWLQAHKPQNVEMHDASKEYSQIALQGPNAFSIIQQLTSRNISLLHAFEFIECQLDNKYQAILSRTGYTGEDGFEIYLKNEDAIPVWELLMGIGAAFDIRPVGLGARDTLRLEAGLCLYGHEIDDTTSPLEAGLGWITKLEKHVDFVDKAFLISQKETGLKRQLVGFELTERGIPRQGYNLLDQRGNKIGKVTSGTMSPMTRKGIGMGYVPHKFTNLGTDINVEIRDKVIKAKIVKRPFIKKQYVHA